MKTQMLRFMVLILVAVVLPFRGMGQTLSAPQKIKALGTTISRPYGQLLNGKIIFFYKAQPWITDGSTAGTQLIKAIDPNLSASQPAYIYPPFIFNNAVYFYYYYQYSNSLTGLYRTDGTTEGTYRVSTLNIRQAFGIVQNKLFFTAYNSTANKNDLFVSDGTEAGTKSIKANVSLSGTLPIYTLGNHAYFFMGTDNNTISLWKTDGTETGTVLVNDISVSSGRGINAVTVDGNFLFFSISVANSNDAIWRSDGTATGTVQLPNITSPYANFLASIASGRLLYPGDVGGKVLNATDTDQTTTTQLSSTVNQLTIGNGNYGKTANTFYFASYASSLYTYMQTDGTPAGTKPISITTSVDDAQIATIQNKTYFTSKGLFSTILWRIDEQGQLRQLNIDYKPDGSRVPFPTIASYSVSDITRALLGEVNNKLLFVGIDPDMNGENYALSSIDLPAAGPVCSLAAAISGNTTLPCTANATVPLTASATGGTAPLTFQWQRNGSNISGATSATYAAGATGDYTVVVTDNKSCSVVSPIQTVAAAKPVSATIGGATVVCTQIISSINYVPTLQANITGGTAPFSYHWALASSPLSSTTAEQRVSSGGIYSLTVTDACSTTVVSKTLTESVIMVSVSGGTTACSSQPTALTASASGGTAPYTYSWALNNGPIIATTPVLAATATSGSYRVVATSANGCSWFSDVVKGGMPVPIVLSITGSTTLCNGQPGTLNASVTGGVAPYIYQWKQNGAVVGTNAASLSITMGGTYSLSVTDACSSTTASVSVSAVACLSPIVSLPSGGATATAPITLTASTGLTGGADAGATYQWFLNGSPITGATSATHIASQSGSYAVTITLNGRTVTSPAVAIIINLILAVEPLITLTEDQVTIYPNPTSGECWVIIDVAARQDLQLQVLDESGHSIQQWNVIAFPKMPYIRIKLPETGGLYFLRSTTGKSSVVKKILRLP